MCGLDAALGELHGDAADLLHRPPDQERVFVCRRRSVFLSGAAFALLRIMAAIAKASMTSETCWCQSCHDRKPPVSRALFGFGG
jgi:hypothetical protein